MSTNQSALGKGGILTEGVLKYGSHKNVKVTASLKVH